MTNLTKQLHHLSFKLTIFILSVVLVCFIAGGTYTLNRVYQTTLKETQTFSDVSLETAINALDQQLEKVENATNSMNEYTDLITSDPQSAYVFLQKLLDRCSYISAATFLFRENFYPQIGSEYAPSIKEEYMKDKVMNDDVKFGLKYLDDIESPDTNWLSGSKGKSLWSQPYRQTQPPYSVRVAYSTPMYNKNKEFMGVLCSTIETNWVYNEIKCAISNNNAKIRVMHYSGLYFCHPDTNMLMFNSYEKAKKNNDKQALEILELMKSGKKGFMETNTDNTDLYTYFAPLKRADWSVAISYPKSQVFATTNDLFHNLLLIQFGVILLLMLFIPFGVFFIVKPYLIKVKTFTEASTSLERDLEIASKLQKGMLPTVADELFECDSVDLACWLQPAKMVGGDLYDFFMHGDNLYFCIGDVSGKGVPAALFMAVIRTMFRDIAKYETSPDAIVSHINNQIMQKNTQCMFCTMFVAVLHTDTRVLEYCNAGHNPPIIYRVNNSEPTAEFTSTSDNLPIGVLEDVEFSKQSIVLDTNDSIFLYTDGITEAENAESCLFGEERMLDIVRKNGHLQAKNVLSAMYETVKCYSDGVEQSDDICMMNIILKK